MGKKNFGQLAPKYNFALNPYPDVKSTTCPNCENKTGQRKLPLLIHVDPKHLIALNYSNRYCRYCDMLIGHKHAIEHLLTELFQQSDPTVVGNDYIIIGTVEKKAWREATKKSTPAGEMLPYVHDFKSHQEVRMTMGGWFPQGKKPPVRTPPPSQEWVSVSE